MHFSEVNRDPGSWEQPDMITLPGKSMRTTCVIATQPHDFVVFAWRPWWVALVRLVGVVRRHPRTLLRRSYILRTHAYHLVYCPTMQVGMYKYNSYLIILGYLSRWTSDIKGQPGPAARSPGWQGPLGDPQALSGAQNAEHTNRSGRSAATGPLVWTCQTALAQLPAHEGSPGACCCALARFRPQSSCLVQCWVTTEPLCCSQLTVGPARHSRREEKVKQITGRLEP